MAELKRKEEQLTTADLAGRKESQKGPQEVPDKPKPVQSATAEEGMHRPAAIHDVKDRPMAVPPERTHSGEGSELLFSEGEVTELRSRWSNVQTGFVDEPRKAVEEADQLVASVMTRLAEGFAKERSTLEKQWDRGDNVSTEDLRVALQRYRSFFDRLLNA